MNQLEDRLKDAYAAAIETVNPENIRQLDEQSVLITWPQAERPRSTRRWAMPLAAVATLAIIVAASLPTFLPSSSHGGGRAPSGLGERFIGAFTPNTQTFFIINALTGVRIAAVTPPSRGEIFRTVATGNGITYVTAVSAPGACGARLYKFSLNSAGKPSKLTPFDGGRLLQDVTELALSADGHAFAYLVHTCPFAKQRNGYVYFVNFKTGLHRQWRVARYTTFSGISLTANGGQLAVGGSPIDGLRSGILLKPTTDGSRGGIDYPERALVAADKLGHHHGFSVSLPAVTPDGRTVFFVSIGPGHANPGEQIRSIAVKFTRPRSVIKLVANVNGMTSLAADPSVSRVIGIHQAGIPKPKAFMINLRTGRINYLKSSFYLPPGGRYVW
ncbi:MAG TPA: hypothetical protein VFI65_30155 [Streptosporangiaceae bacterium]|nr:hypothetical protein [Streptosporangiaceae bacterium]